MFRFFRFMVLMFHAGRRKTKFSAGVIHLNWLLAWFDNEKDREFVRRVVIEMRDVVKSLNTRTTVMTWERLWRFKYYDRKYFLGIDLITSPTRSIICLLHHYGDLDDRGVIKSWDWATQRDAIVVKKHSVGSRYIEHVNSMRKTIILFNNWVTDRRVKCEASASMPPRMV